MIQEEKDSAEQRAEELESQVGGAHQVGGAPSAGGQEAMVSRWHTHPSFGVQMSSPGTDLPAVPSPAMHPRSAVAQQKYLVVSTASVNRQYGELCPASWSLPLWSCLQLVLVL